MEADSQTIQRSEHSPVFFETFALGSEHHFPDWEIMDYELRDMKLPQDSPLWDVVAQDVLSYCSDLPFWDATSLMFYTEACLHHVAAKHLPKGQSDTRPKRTYLTQEALAWIKHKNRMIAAFRQHKYQSIKPRLRFVFLAWVSIGSGSRQSEPIADVSL